MSDFQKIGVTFKEVSNTRVSDTPAVSWTAIGYPAAPEPTQQVYFVRDNYLYRITGYPATASTLQIFDKFIQSFK